MPGGSMMSTVWAPMPGQTWPAAAASFVGIWIVMMAAMMLPSVLPTLWRYAQTVARTGASHPGLLTTVVALGYLFVWTLVGIAVFPLGAGLVALEMDQPALARAAPIAVGVVVVLAGLLQLTAWKRHHLARCRPSPDRAIALRSDAGGAWRHGVRLGLDCCRCCANLMTILLVVGLMDGTAMIVVSIAIAAERLVPAGYWVARVTGVIAIGVGFALVARALGLS
jgi:predicted metal-binding membrane protein